MYSNTSERGTRTGGYKTPRADAGDISFAIGNKPVLAPLETTRKTTNGPSKPPEKSGPWKVFSDIVAAGLNTITKALHSERGTWSVDRRQMPYSSELGPTGSGGASQPIPRKTKITSPTASRSKHRKTQKPS